MLKKLSILSVATIASLTLNQEFANAITGDGGSTGWNPVSTRTEESYQKKAVQEMNFFVNSGKIQKIPGWSSRFKNGNNVLNKLNTRNYDISNKLILSSNIDIQWWKTPASGIGDVAVSRSGRVWLAGKNGTIWYTDNGTAFNKIDAKGFSRLAVSENNILWAVGFNGTLWSYASGEWWKTPASGIGDVAVSRSGRVWLAGKNGTIWYTNNGTAFNKIDAKGFSRLAVSENNILWAVGFNGTLWKYASGEWWKTPASGMSDVAISRSGRVWLTGKNGTIWYTDNGTTLKKIDGEGFDSISTNNNNILWAVGTNGTLWKRK